MRTYCLPLLVAAVALAQDPVDRKSEAREHARKLLDSAAELVPAAEPQIQVVALMHLADNYQVMDSKRSLGLFQQAFAAAAQLPAEAVFDPRTQLQAEIVRQVSAFDLSTATRLLRQIAPGADSERDPRDTAIRTVVRLLLDRQQVDTAFELIESLGATGGYPYLALGSVIEKLQDEDPRRVTAFGAAMAAFANRPRNEFGLLLARDWKLVPAAMAQSAAESFVNWILDRKDENYTAQSLATARGAVTFSTRQEAELFDIMYVVRQVNPKRADEIAARYPALAAALDKFPQGSASMVLAGGGINTAITRSGEKISPERESEQRMNAIAQSRAAAALTWVAQDPAKAVELVQTVPSPAKQAETLGLIAQAVAEKDESTAKSVLKRSVALLDDIKDPAQRVRTWEIVAEAAHKVQDDKLAWHAIGKGMSDSEALYRRDADAEMPNHALREYWPSTQSYRGAIATAAKLFGAEAESLLVGITDPDLALLARIEVAQALLGRGRTNTMTAISRPK